MASVRSTDPSQPGALFWLLVLLALLWSPAGLIAQTTTASIRGFVRTAAGAPVGGATVTAADPETGLRRRAVTTENGFFNLSGLQPGSYQVAVTAVGYAAQPRTLRLLVGQTLNLDLTVASQAVAIEGLTVTADQATVETESPEVATNITREQIENIPIPDRNFLTLALLAPDVRSDGTSITAGGQGTGNINVFIDGVSFKNDILQGGAVGQDASKGNPFLQDAARRSA